MAQVSIHEGSILDLEVDALVSPGNSFGYTDGGIDLEYTFRQMRAAVDACLFDAEFPWSVENATEAHQSLLR